MTKVAKRMKAIYDEVDRDKFYPLDEAITLVKKGARAKFDESIDVAINLGVNARQSDQNVRGATVMPQGTGKNVRIAVFADGPAADQAREAGADLVGMNDLAETISGGEIDFDVAIATPDAMPVVGKLGQILGPRGLMPNPKVGTVTPDVAKAISDAKAGQVQFRIDKAGIVHCLIGKSSFEDSALKENLSALLDALVKAKPSAAKGQFIRRVTLSTTMGPGVRVDRASLDL